MAARTALIYDKIAQKLAAFSANLHGGVARQSPPARPAEAWRSSPVREQLLH
jgi:hypothetical protein